MFNISPYGNIVILTGAGISAESGLATFRASDGLWANYKIEDVCKPKALQRNPEKVHEFYNLRRRELHRPDIAPNAAHFALTELQEKWLGDITLITQNVDNLHERAGTRDVVHMHGELFKLWCRKCHKKYVHTEDCFIETACAICKKPKGLRPDIVFFEEMPYHSNMIYTALNTANLFVSIGTSGNVYPAAGFVGIARQNGIQAIEINLEESLNAAQFTQGFYGPATVEVPKFVKALLQHAQPG